MKYCSRFYFKNCVTTNKKGTDSYCQLGIASEVWQLWLHCQKLLDSCGVTEGLVKCGQVKRVITKKQICEKKNQRSRSYETKSFILHCSVIWIRVFRHLYTLYCIYLNSCWKWAMTSLWICIELHNHHYIALSDLFLIWFPGFLRTALKVRHFPNEKHGFLMENISLLLSNVDKMTRAKY